ncbi:hypothetical protein K502DRAFT_349094 [Neoconidiobolus thromboides FSU 785]|nr:hypothetical protein K502DRAFT_349094 [Neoconidiobolus thromboides FSU 785]
MLDENETFGNENFKIIKVKGIWMKVRKDSPLKEDSPDSNIAVNKKDLEEHKVNLLERMVNSDENFNVVTTEETKRQQTKRKPSGTHFLSLPIMENEVVDSVQQLQRKILGLGREDIHYHFLIKPPSIHLTLGLLCLQSKSDEMKALNILNGLRTKLKEIMARTALSLLLEGLDTFPESKKGELSKVIYASIDNSYQQNKEKLNVMIEVILERFRASGLLIEDNRPLTLHATILKFRSVRGLETNTIQLRGFNAREIIEKFGTFSLGTFKITHLQICQLGSFQPDGKYTSLGGIRIFP